MNLAYKIKAADGQIYGPAPVEDIQQWITDGRVDGYTLFAMFKGFRACGERAEYLRGKGLPV